MPGTNYTTNLRLANPSLNDTGWGTTVSSGMIDLTDQAIAGLATADVTSADVTLTIVDGSAGVNSARNMFLNITGTPGVARAVIVPTNRKLYFVTNNCGQIATVKVSGQTGVAVPAGASVTLRINAAGTDVAPAFTYAASMSLGTALPATSGGTGQASYAVGDLLYASTTTALSKLTVGATNSILTVIAGVPTWTTTLGIANGGTGQTTAATAFDALKQAATDTYTGVVELATAAEVQTGTDTTRAITPSTLRGGALYIVDVTVGSVTSYDVLGVPSWAKRITVTVVAFNVASGTTGLVLQLGTSSGVATTGYIGSVSNIDSSTANAFGNQTWGFPVSSFNSSRNLYGTFILTKTTGNSWTCTHTIGAGGSFTAFTAFGSGFIGLASTLDRIRITSATNTGTSVGTTTLLGTVSLTYE